jgi:hypothetical protein
MSGEGARETDVLIDMPETLPLVNQDITIIRCTVCGAVVPGMWMISRETMRAGIDHSLDRHSADLIAGRLKPPLFVDCAIQDPFWFEEHA